MPVGFGEPVHLGQRVAVVERVDELAVDVDVGERFHIGLAGAVRVDELVAGAVGERLGDAGRERCPVEPSR